MLIFTVPNEAVTLDKINEHQHQTSWPFKNTLFGLKTTYLITGIH